MRRLAAIYGLIALFVSSERFLRQGTSAKSLEAQEADRGSTRGVARALGLSTLALLAAPPLNGRRIAPLPKRDLALRAGISTMAAGLLLRSWANRVLGASYTRTLRVDTEQHIIQDGLYRLVRHPGYLGTMMVWIGAELAAGNGIVTAVVSAILIRAYRKRIAAEEGMLLDSFGDDYADYMRRTWRLVPFLY